MIKNVTDETFGEDVLSSPAPVVVDFWAPWCNPCKVMLPIIQEINDSEPGYEIVKVNVDDNPELMQKYGVMAIPTMVVFSDGEPRGVIPGAQAKVVLMRKVSELLQ